MRDGLVAEYLAAVVGLRWVVERVAALRDEAVKAGLYLPASCARALFVALWQANEALGRGGSGVVVREGEKGQRAAADLEVVVGWLVQTSVLFDELRRKCTAAALYEQAILTVGLEADLARVRHRLERVAAGLMQQDTVV